VKSTGNHHCGIMTTSGKLHMERCTQPTLAARYKWVVKHRTGRPNLDAQPNSRLFG